MKLRILWQDLFVENVDRPNVDLLWAALQKYFKKMARPDTEITLSHVNRDAGHPRYHYFETINSVQMASSIIRAEKDGYDAAILDCFLDTGLEQSRGVVSIPVVSPGESSMLLAMLLGKKFAIIAVVPEIIPIIEHKLHGYGFSERAIQPVRSMRQGYWPLLIKSLKGDPGPLITSFEEVALKYIADGADVVIPSCNYVGPAFTLAGYHEVGNTGVPVVDTGAASIKLAESLAEIQKLTGLKRSQSITSLYQLPPREILEKVMQTFGY